MKRLYILRTSKAKTKRIILSKELRSILTSLDYDHWHDVDLLESPIVDHLHSQKIITAVYKWLRKHSKRPKPRRYRKVRKTPTPTMADLIQYMKGK